MNRFGQSVIAVLVGLVVGFGFALVWFPGLAKTGYVIPISISIPFLIWLLALFFYRRGDKVLKQQGTNNATESKTESNFFTDGQSLPLKHRIVRSLLSRRFVLIFLFIWFISTILSLMFLIIMLLLALRSFT